MFFSEAFSSSIILPGGNDNKIVYSSFPNIPDLKIKDLAKTTGKRLSLKQKIELKILKFTVGKKLFRHGLQKRETDKGQLALILSIIGLASLIIPYVALISLPCAIAALIIGYSARRQYPNNKKAKTAIILGWTTIAIFVFVLILVIAILTTFAWY
jgi:hypothetical protein